MATNPRVEMSSETESGSEVEWEDVEPLKGILGLRKCVGSHNTLGQSM